MLNNYINIVAQENVPFSSSESQGNLVITVSSPLEQFETTPLTSLSTPILGDFVFSLTNVGLYTLLVLALGIGYHALAANNSPSGSNGTGLVPSK